MNIQGTLVILFVIATGVAIMAKWLRVPYTVCLVLAGLALGALNLSRRRISRRDCCSLSSCRASSSTQRFTWKHGSSGATA